MNAISKALDEIKFNIPLPILETVFINRLKRYRTGPASLDDLILSAVIRPRVMVDCNLVGGTEAFISLNGVPMERFEDYTTIYTIPKTHTQNRSIQSALNITFSDPARLTTYGTAASTQSSTMMLVGQSVMDAMGSIPMVETARVQLIGENVVMVRDSTYLPANIYLRCILENDSVLSHLQLKSYGRFSELVVLAVKAYIYNNYIVSLDIGELHGGQTLGVIKEIIDRYADAEELYKTFLREKWTKIAMMNDRESMTRHLKMIMGGPR